jgi:glucose-1-phosphate cytidylyltransferase
MKVVILAGGFGTRISEESHLIPKPMIKIGDKPILWHIMKYYSHFGFNEFIILAGYKQDVIKEFFNNYYLHTSNVTFDLTTGKANFMDASRSDNWNVTVIDSGLETMTAGRLLYAKDLLPNEDFFLTYGDGVSNVDLNALQEKHKVNKSVVTLTAIQPSGRFGILQIDSDSKIQAFREKNQEDVSWINGGFMIVNKKIFNYFNSTKDILERDVLPSLINDGNLSALKHKGFWQCMDTMRDKELLDRAIKEKNAPWMVWSSD